MFEPLTANIWKRMKKEGFLGFPPEPNFILQKMIDMGYCDYCGKQICDCKALLKKLKKKKVKEEIMDFEEN